MDTMNRRALLRGATAATFASAFACSVPSLAFAGDLPQGGCAFCNMARLSLSKGAEQAGDPPTPNNPQSPSTTPSRTPPRDMGLTQTTGDEQTDRFLAAAVARLSATFEVKPRFAFFNDHDSPNAFALREDNAVLMGKRLFGQYMARNEDGMIVIGILAHEFGHIYQYRSNCIRELAPLSRSVMPAELHADFLAGFYLAQRKAEHPNLDLQAVGGAFDTLGDVNFEARTHHGTNEQRIAAVTAGFTFAKGRRPSVDQVSAAGLAYVRRVV